MYTTFISRHELCLQQQHRSQISQSLPLDYVMNAMHMLCSSCVAKCAPHQFAGELRVRNRRGLLGAGVFAAAGVLAAGVFGGLPGPCMCQHNIAMCTGLQCGESAVSAAGVRGLYSG